MGLKVDAKFICVLNSEHYILICSNRAVLNDIIIVDGIVILL